MKRAIPVLLAVLIFPNLLFVLSCKSEESYPDTPEGVVNMYVQHMFIEPNYQKVKNLVSTNSLDIFNETFPSEKAFKEFFATGEGEEFVQNFKRVEIDEITIEGQTAEVECIAYFKQATSSYPEAKDPSFPFYLVKENDQWKIDLKNW
jgi:hypothetical protein